MSLGQECLEKLWRTLAAASVCGASYVLGVQPSIGVLEAIIGGVGLATVLGQTRAQEYERVLDKVKRQTPPRRRRDSPALTRDTCSGL